MNKLFYWLFWYSNKRFSAALLLLFVMSLVCGAGAFFLDVAELLNLGTQSIFWRLVCSWFAGLMIGAIIVGLLFLYYGMAERNWRVAIDDAIDFIKIKKNHRFGPKINELTYKTRRTKNPAELNKAVKDCRELQRCEEKAREVENEKAKIQKLKEELIF